MADIIDSMFVQVIVYCVRNLLTNMSNSIADLVDSCGVWLLGCFKNCGFAIDYGCLET